MHRAALTTKNYLVQNVNGTRLKILIWRVERIYWQWEGIPAGIRKSRYRLRLDSIEGCPEVPSSLHPSGCKFLIHLPDFTTA